MAAMMSHVMAMIILLSFFEVSSTIVLVSSVVGGGIGGSIGGFFAWFSPSNERKENLQILALAFVGGMGGALLGLLRGINVDRDPLALVGIPELANLVAGTMIGVNLVLLCYFIFRTLRGEKLA
jgi:hypothetical protein